MKYLGTKNNFLGIEEKEFHSYADSKYVIQQIPYEYTSSYLSGSSKGPKAIVEASHFVEFYDEELNQETYKLCGIATLPPIEFKNKVNEKALKLIEKETAKLLKHGKFVISLGAEHTVTLGFVKAFKEKYKNFTVLQLDAHSDLRESYHDNKYSHASVMARVHELGIPLTQIGIRAQCKQEADLIRSSDDINTFYAHQVKSDPQWMDKAINTLSENVYLSIDADGFDPSIVPAVGTAEPNGLLWDETLNFLKKVIDRKNVIGFDVVEIAPRKGDILTEYTMAKLVYKIVGYLTAKK